MLRYDVVVVDEAHERTLNTDFICGALKRIQRIRKKLVAEQNASLANGDKGKGKEKDAKDKVTELKIVIMSATLDPAKFSRFFETYVEINSGESNLRLIIAIGTLSWSRDECTRSRLDMSRALSTTLSRPQRRT